MSTSVLLMTACTLAAAGANAGQTFYVSRLGDNSDGRSWETAFRSIQAALDAIPDARGGHRIIVRPDTYMEANLAPAFPGAEGAYNVIEADKSGSRGSGARGYAVIDNSGPDKGFKSYDWYGTVRAYKKGWSDEHTGETFSAIVWDRWVVRGLYATGGDGAWMFDTVDTKEPFTVVCEDCVGIGRAFGGGVSSCLKREGEPSVFRRCMFWSLDEWGDTAAGYVRVENETMPETPDVVFEDCTLVSPQCALKGNNYTFHVYSRVLLRRCILIALNFSQPHGTPTDGVIQSVQHGKYLHVDLEDCTLMGFKVFGVKVEKDTAGEIGFTAKGDVKAYVQFTQDVPRGMHRLTHWPAELFARIAPPEPWHTGPPLMKEDVKVYEDMCEVEPVIWDGRPCMLECHRPGSGGELSDYYLLLRDTESGKELARFAEGHGLACAIVRDGVFYAFAARWENGTWNDVTLFKSADLNKWESKVVIEQENEALFNSTVCAGPDGFVMAYETNDGQWPAFSIKFATSSGLETWRKVPDAVFGTDRYTACPCIRYADGWYYMLYLERRSPRWFFETWLARSKDLVTWELARGNPVLTPSGLDEGINASDPAIIELEGKTHLYYAVGDQRTWMNIKRATFGGPLADFLSTYFEENARR